MRKEWEKRSLKWGEKAATRLRGLIFDLDGTLVSSSLDFTRIRADIGCPKEKDVLTHISEMPREHRARAERIVAEHEQRDARQCECLPGVADSLQWLQAQGLHTAVVTRNSRRAASQKLQHAGLNFDQVLTREDAPPKPHPGALLQVAERWGLETSDCAYVGDFLYDVEAALAANMQAWLYSPSALPDYAYRAHVVLRHFEELPALVNRGLESVGRDAFDG